MNFISQLLLAYYFGTTVERDVFFSASVISTYIITVITTSVSAVFLPALIDVRKNAAPESENVFSRTFLLVSFLSLLAVAGLVFGFSDFIVTYIYPQFQGAAQVLLVRLLKILVLSIVFQSVSTILAIFYNSRSKFFVSALNPVINTTAIIVLVFFYNQEYGIVSIAFGTVIGNFLNVVLMLPQVSYLLRKPYSLSFSDPKLKSVFRVIGLLLLTNVVIRLTPVLERIIAAGLSRGSISYLGYANQITLILITLTSSSIATTIFPVLSSAWSENNFPKLRATFVSSIRILLLLSIPVVSVFLISGTSLVKITFERGKFGPEATLAVANAGRYLMGFFLFGSLGNIVFKIFYIANRSKLVVLISLVEIIAYLLLTYLLVPHYKYLGLAIALSASAGINIILAFFFLVKNLKVTSFRDIRAILTEFGLLFGLHLVLMYLAKVLYQGLENDYICALLEILTGNLLFILISVYIIKNKELNELTHLIQEKIRKTKQANSAL